MINQLINELTKALEMMIDIIRNTYSMIVIVILERFNKSLET
jgi:hypothetical protein